MRAWKNDAATHRRTLPKDSIKSSTAREFWNSQVTKAIGTMTDDELSTLSRIFKTGYSFVLIIRHGPIGITSAEAAITPVAAKSEQTRIRFT